MDASALAFLAEPWFVLSWYALGVVGAVAVAVDLARTNTALKPAMKWAWPIIVLFFSVLGVFLYLATARAPGIGRMNADEKKCAHAAYEESTLRRVNGAVIHCVAGDGLGIMSAMVIARLLRMTFWQEFWFEYAVGFAFGWFIFQLRSMVGMTDSKWRALAMAFRAEMFSMMTVMGGMGAVMAFVTPAVVGAQPRPDTYAFWGFGMLGLLVGYVATFPMNWMLVKVGWKHGMGPERPALAVRSASARQLLFASMLALGAVGLAVPAWLADVREGHAVGRVAPRSAPDLAADAHALPVALVEEGIRADLRIATDALAGGWRQDATTALDAARRAAMVVTHARPGAHLDPVLAGIEDARRALQLGRPGEARARLLQAIRGLHAEVPSASPPVAAPGGYAGVPLINAQGVRIGEVAGVRADQIEVDLGGHRDVWGGFDLGVTERVAVPADRLIFGVRRTLGRSFVLWPTFATSPRLLRSELARAEPVAAGAAAR